MPLFDRERRKGPVRDVLLPKTTSLRPRDIFDAKFTYDQAMKEDENPKPLEPLHPIPALPIKLPTGASMQESTSTACVPCSKAHVAAIAGALSESPRFARDGGLSHQEVKSRIGIATEELAAMERIDLHPDKVSRLKGKEREVAEWILRRSRNLRHTIDKMRSVDDLYIAIQEASEFNRELNSKFWDMIEENK